MSKMDTDEDENLARQQGGTLIKLYEEQTVGCSLFQYEDILFGPYYLKLADIGKNLKAIKQLKHRPDDIILVTYPKSGTHWMSNLLYMMTSDGPIDKKSTIEVPHLLLDIKQLENQKAQRIMHTHLKFDRLPTEHVENGGIIILTVRNPKDVAVSLHYYSTGSVGINSQLSWSAQLKYFMEGKVRFGSIFEYLRHWNHVIRTHNYPKILVVYYEELKKKPVDVVRHIQNFLGLKLNDERINDIIARCSLERLKRDSNDRHKRHEPLSAVVNKENKTVVYRKGVIGDWMNHFTVAQNIEFDELMKNKLSDTMFKFDYYPDNDAPK
ncbi:hypothetical protein ACF0H5_022034 [Mactra antiquata]